MEDDLELDVIDNSQDADKEQEKFTGTLGADQDNDQAMVRASPQAPLYFAFFTKLLERRASRESTFT